MATFYLDCEGGNDANDGTTFANRWKTLTSGATAARTAPGDTIRIMGSPDPTSLGINGTWTDSTAPLTTYSIVSSTNATPIVVTLSSGNYTLLNPAVGDTVVVTGHTTNTKANGVWEILAVNGSTTITLGNADGSNSVGNGVGGATGTVRKATNCRVKLASALTAAIAEVGNQGVNANWTASANVTCTKSTSDFKEGGECQSIAIAAAFTTGKAAYVATTSTLDLSGYKQVTFWIKQTTGTVAVSGDLTLRLCSDAIGAVTVDTITVPSMPANNVWMPMTVDLGAALGASIASVALYVAVDRGASTFLIDCITACKDSTSNDSLSLVSLIGKNTGSETWYGIQSINGTRVMLDNHVAALTTTIRGYSGTTETVTTYKRETIKLTPGTADMAVQEAGTSGSPITYSGGWNRTDMSTQTLETWLDRRGGSVAAFSCNVAFISIEKINIVRSTGFAMSGADFTMTGTMAVINSTAAPVISGVRATLGNLIANNNGAGPSFTGQGFVGSNVVANNNLTNGLSVSTVIGARLGDVTADNNSTIGVNAGFNTVYKSITARYNATYGIQCTLGAVAYGGSTTGNVSGGIGVTSSSMTFRRFTVNESTKVANWTAASNSAAIFESYAGTADDHRHYYEHGLVSSETTVRHTASGIAWKMQPTSTSCTSRYPLTLSLAVVHCAANALVTVKAWMRRSNTGLTMRLVLKPDQLTGLTSEVSDDLTAAIDTWEEQTITFTPTEAGAVEIIAEAYGGTTYTGYIDDLTVTQA